MKTLFIYLDLLGIVESVYQVPKFKVNLIEAQQKGLKENKSRHACVLRMIQRGVSKSIFPRIVEARRLGGMEYTSRSIPKEIRK